MFKNLSAVFLFSVTLVSASAWAAPDSVNGFYGSYGAHANIEVPRFHGIEPNLRFVYNSGGGSGPVGVGWALTGISEISRSRPNGGVARGDDTDVYALDGIELISDCELFGGTHCSRIRDYQRIRYLEAEDAWLVTGTTGVRSRYESIGPDRYRVTEIRDLTGNVVRYGYDGGRIDRISYSIYEIDFVWGARPDATYRPIGTSVEVLRHRLDGVVVYAESSKIRGYRLAYRTSRVTGRSLLDGIVMAPGEVMEGVDHPRSDLPATAYTWGDTGGVAFRALGSEQSGRHREPARMGSLRFGDLNGDGRTDILTRSADGEIRRNHARQATVQMSSEGVAVDGAGLWPWGRRSSPLLCGEHWRCRSDGRYPWSFLGWDRAALGDLDGDGEDEILIGELVIDGSRSSDRTRRFTAYDWHHEFRTEWGYRWTDRAFDEIARGRTRTRAHNWYFEPQGQHLLPRVHLGDVDSDGAVDVLSQTLMSGEVFFHASGPDGPSEPMPVDICRPGDSSGCNDVNNHATVGLADFDADGQLDIIYRADSGIRVRFGEARAFERELSTTLCADGTGCAEAWHSLRYADTNGDGTSDVIHLADGGVVVDVSTGAGFSESIQTGVCAEGSRCDRSSVRYVDVVGDGRADIVFRHRDRGITIVPFDRPDVRYHTDLCADDDPANQCSSDEAHDTIEFQDLVGAGRPDIVFQRDDGEISIHVNVTGKDLLTATENGRGARVDVVYSPSSRWNKLSDHQQPPRGATMSTVESVTTTDRFGKGSRVSYAYEGPLWLLKERKFLGFRKVTSVVDETGSYVETYYRQKEGGIAKPDQTRHLRADGALLSATTFRYAENTEIPFFSRLVEKWTEQCEPEPRRSWGEAETSCRTLKQTMSHDVFGNILRVQDYGLDGHEGDEKTTIVQYHRNDRDFVVALPESRRIYRSIQPSLETLVEAAVYEYDGSLLKAEGRWDSTTGEYLYARRDYDEAGNLTEIVDPLGHATRTRWDTHGLFPEQTENVEGQLTVYAYNTAYGLLLEERGVNGFELRRFYDTYGRLVRERSSSGQATRYLHDRNVTQTVTEGASTVWRHDDGLGRIALETENVDGLVRRRREYQYVGGSQRLRCDSGWLRRGTTNGCRQGTEADPFTADLNAEAGMGGHYYSYDERGRQVYERNRDGQVFRSVYDLVNGQTQVARYDAQNYVQKSIFDGQGNLVRTELGQLSSNWIPVRLEQEIYGTAAVYAYDALGRMISAERVRSGASEGVEKFDARTTVTWDSLGRKQRLCSLAAGCTNFEYDAGSRLSRSLDASGREVLYAYDALGRLVRKSAGKRAFQYHYDESAAEYSLGRLTRVEQKHDLGKQGWRVIAGKSFAYDLAGNVLREAHCSWAYSRSLDPVPWEDRVIAPANVEGLDAMKEALCATFSRNFDEYGRLRALTYPDDERIGYEYGDDGQISQIPGLVNRIERDLDNRIVSLRYANGVEETTAYDGVGRILSTAVATDGEVPFRETYRYDGSGRLSQLDAFGDDPRQSTYEYDRKGQLKTVRTTTAGAEEQSESFDYDWPFGNKRAFGWGYYDPETKRLESTGTRRYSYDEAGRLRGSESRLRNGSNPVRFRYDGLGRLHTRRVAGTDTELSVFWYDENGQRIRRAHRAAARFGWDSDRRFYSHLAERDGETWTNNYYLGGLRVAEGSEGRRNFLHRDRLGSLRVRTDDDGRVQGTASYGSWGASDVDNTVGFTGHRQDSSKLIYMGARYYDPSIGRFITPDSIVPSTTNPLGLGRYTYAYNDPVNWVDPDGHAPVAVAVVSAAVASAGASAAVATVLWVGAGMTTLGYLTRDSNLMAMGSIVTGFASGGLTGGLLAFATSPVSPLDSGTRNALAWAQVAYGAYDAARSGSVTPANGGGADPISIGTGQDAGLGALSAEPLADVPSPEFGTTLSREFVGPPDYFFEPGLVDTTVQDVVTLATGGAGMARSVAGRTASRLAAHNAVQASQSAVQTAFKRLPRVAAYVRKSLDAPVEAFAAKFLKARVRRAMPGQFMNMSVRDALASGNSRVRKLLTDRRFQK